MTAGTAAVPSFIVPTIFATTPTCLLIGIGSAIPDPYQLNRSDAEARSSKKGFVDFFPLFFLLHSIVVGNDIPLLLAFL